MIVAAVVALFLQIAPPPPPIAPLAPLAPLAPYVSHERYIFVDGDSTTNRGTGGEAARALRAAYGPHFFWYRYDGASYLVQDEATLRAIHDLFRRQTELGQEQSALGRRQSEIGREQSALGRQQSQLGREQSRTESRVRMRELGEEMRELGDKMRGLGDQMREEGDKIDRRLRAMMPDLIKRGVAREMVR